MIKTRSIYTQTGETKKGEYFIMINGTNSGRVTKTDNGWTSTTTRAGFDHIVVTAKTKKASVESWVDEYLKA